MKLGIVISSNEAENAWNAFRLANLALDKKDEVRVFLVNSGVECLLDTAKYNVKTLSEQFEKKGGHVLACGTCIKSRKLENVCELSTMETLYSVIKESEKTVFF